MVVMAGVGVWRGVWGGVWGGGGVSSGVWVWGVIGVYGDGMVYGVYGVLRCMRWVLGVWGWGV